MIGIIEVYGSMLLRALGQTLLLTLLLLIQLLLILLSNLKLLANEKMRETTAGLRSSGFFVL